MDKDSGVQTPIAILAVIALTFTFQFLYLQSIQDENEKNFNVQDPNNSTTFDFQEDPGVFGVLGAIWDVVLVFVDFLTFNVPGAPGWVRFLVSVIIDGALAWSIVALVRGA